MTLLKNIFLLVLLFTAKAFITGQTKTGSELMTRAEDFKIQERVLLTLDQDFYLVGEPVNFFAVTYDAAFQIPIDFSAVLYVELYDQDNNIFSSKKFLLNHGEGNYYITLPRQLETGYYYIRAYTNYMKNFGPEAFFTKRLKIINPFYETRYFSSQNINSGNNTIEVAAEGGKLLYNTENKIAFYGSNYKSRILARLYKNDSVIAEVMAPEGFGIFVFTPENGNRYKIEAASAHNEKTTIELNKIYNSGVICKLDSIKNGVAFLNLISENYSSFPLSVHIKNNGVLYKYPKTITQQATSLEIKLPAGLNKITVKNNGNETVSERFIYNEPHPNLNFTASLNNSNSVPGDSVMLHIESGSADTTQYVIALSLGRSGSLQNMIESSVKASSLAALNISSVNELEYICNNVNNLNDYILKFKHAEPKTSMQDKVSYLPEITHDIVTGSVRTQKDRLAAKHKNIYLSFVDSICWINRGKTDNYGRFTANLPFEYQGNDLFISVQDTTEIYNITFENEFYPDFLTINKENYYPDSSLKQTVEQRMINLQVNDAYSVQHSGTESSRSSLRFYGYPDFEYKFRKYINLPNLEEFVFEIVEGATIVRKNKHVNIRVLDENKYIIGEKPMIILDGIPLLNTENLSSIPSEKFESIRTVSNKFFFGPEYYDGIIDITSNTKSFSLIEPDKNSTRIIFNPIVTTNNRIEPQNSRTPDYVSVIYFQKISSATGNEDIKLRLPQNTGTYSLNVWCYTKSGKWGSTTLPDALKINR